MARRFKLDLARVAKTAVLFSAVVVALGAGSAAPAAAKWGDPPQKACSRQVTPTQNYEAPRKAERVDASALFVCQDPKTSGAIDTGASIRTSTSGRWQPGDKPPVYPPPQAGTACSYYYTSGLSIDPPGPARRAHWTPPQGMNEPGFADLFDAPSQDLNGGHLISVEEVHTVTGLNTAQMRYIYRGTYNGTDWQCGNGRWDRFDSGACLFGGRLAKAFDCVYLQPYGVVPSRPVPPDPTPYIDFKEVSKMVVAGKLGTSPADPTRQFVNLPDCWWVNGIEPHQAFELKIDVPPDPTPQGGGGRAVTYTYRIDIGLQKVQWDYGDGSAASGDGGYPYTGAGCSNPHPYERVSTLGNRGAVVCPADYPHPTADDGCYMVKALETYSADVTASWFDGQQNHVVPIGGLSPFTIPADPTYVRMLQIEGIPVSR